MDEQCLASNGLSDCGVRLGNVRLPLVAVEKNEKAEEHDSHCTSAAAQAGQELAWPCTTAVSQAASREHVQCVDLSSPLSRKRLLWTHAICHPWHA
jgi:hypothetical protein